ncbi:choline BCCT transporter BetT [Galactobacter sp.]|uniref:choline BCCT transporter BetT n=1 Tax=Galactobacter sp. TaxID=2676125 RepID=UPI0025C2ADCD|nr:choline BCCT transporter BetT [Galactobacter sp.]
MTNQSPDHMNPPGTNGVPTTLPPLQPPAAAPAPKPNWVVFIGSGILIVLVALWAIILPDNAGNVITSITSWISSNLGWYYILTAGLMLGFVIFLAASRHGATKLGPDHSKPQFSLFTWTSMLFAAGIGIDLMFFSVAEPVTQYYAPPAGDTENIEAARQAIVWTLFHYGPIGWGMYALMGGAFAYFAYRRNMPLSIRAILTPLFGKKLNGWFGHTVDIAAVLGTVFGIATSLGIGVVQLNYGLHILFGIKEGVGAQIGLIVLSVLMATMSTVSGVEKGIRRLSELNVVLAIVLLVWVTVTGKTRQLLDLLIMNVGDFVSRFPHTVLDTFGWEQPDDWMAGWTLFFWAWWIAWAPFVGLFLARISRGRTLRQFITGVLVIPFLFIALFISIFGNAALQRVMGGDDKFGQEAMNVPEHGFYDLLQDYPAAPFVVGLATVTGLLFYVTSADSGALVLANFTSRITDSKQEGTKGLRIFWSVTTGLLTLAMLLVGGVSTLQGATLIIGLPFSVVMYLVMVSFYRALRSEAAHGDGYRSAAANRPTGGGNWRQRLRRSTVFPTAAQTRRFLEATAEPALADVVAELRHNGTDASLTRKREEGTELDCLVLSVHYESDEDFSYQVHPVAHVVPSFAYRNPNSAESYYRLEVFTGTGSKDYDIYGYTSEQLISDVLGHLESHLEFLRITEGNPVATISENDAPVTDWHEDFESPEDHEASK